MLESLVNRNLIKGSQLEPKKDQMLPVTIKVPYRGMFSNQYKTDLQLLYKLKALLIGHANVKVAVPETGFVKS